MCHASEMKLQVESWIIDVYGAMTLRDTTCKGNLVVKKSGTFWEYAIKNNLASCQNNVQVSFRMILCFVGLIKRTKNSSNKYCAGSLSVEIL